LSWSSCIALGIEASPGTGFELSSDGQKRGMSERPDPPGERPGDEAPAEEPSAGENICPECGGNGEKDGAECPNCEGTGRVVEAIGGG